MIENKDDLREHILREGSYEWECEVDEEHASYNYRLTLRFMVILGAAFIIGALISRDDLMIVAAVFTVIIMLVMGIGIGKWNINRAKHITLPYELTKNHIRIGSGRNGQNVFFKDVQRMEMKENKLVLYGKYLKFFIYVPQKLYEPVKDYVLERLEEEQK